MTVTSSLSAYNGQFVNYKAIHDYKYIIEFTKNEVYSNFKNYKNQITKLIAYEKQRKYTSDKSRKKIYAINLLVMLPKYLTKSQKHEVVKQFMLNISLKYKDILYVYDFIKQGNGSYVNIIIFERQVYRKIHYVNETYNRDMYINKITGRTTNSSDPDCIQVCQKGMVKRDKKGNTIKKEIQVSPKKYKFLKFKDNIDEEKKNSNFIAFKDKLTKKLVMALSKVVNFSQKNYKLRSFQYDNGNKITNKIIKYNYMIHRLNIMLHHVQKLFNYDHAFADVETAYIDFKRLFHGIMKNLENGAFKLNENLTLCIDPSTKQIKEKIFETNINTFEKYMKVRIIEYLYKYFYDPLFDEFYKETKHPFYKYNLKKKN